ncbi:MAG: sulfotransferase family protein, partial [Acidimicrobiaceae bacterium]|nr:sulfotransferase family protein [Acidimicrobiaceae bacterium]
LAMLVAHPEITGASVAPRRVAVLDLASPAPAFPHEALPVERVPTCFTGLTEILGGVGVLPCLMCVHVISRERWLAAVAEDRDGVFMAGDFPQVLILARMFRAAPTWFWHPAQLVLSGAGTFYLNEAGEMAANPIRQIVSMTRDIDHVWATEHGRFSMRYRALMYRWYRICSDGTEVQSSRLAGTSRMRDDIRQFWGAARWFWWIRHFRRHALPWLLLPSALVSRWPAAALRPDEGCTRVGVDAPSHFTTGFQHAVVCHVDNHGSKTLPALGRRPVRIASRWYDERGEHLVGVGPRALIFPSLRPGHSARVELRVDAPHVPGKYQLRITPVQENVRWFDDLDASLGWSGTVTVVDAPRLPHGQPVHAVAD